MSEFRFQDPSASRGALHALTGVAAILILLTVWGIWSHVADSKSRIADDRDLIARAEATTASISGLPEDAFYRADTPQLAQAQMQTDLQELAQTHRIGLEVIRADGIEQSGGLIEIGLVLNGVVPEDALGAFLHDLSTAKPVITVQELNLRRARLSNRQAQRRLISFQLKTVGFTGG